MFPHALIKLKKPIEPVYVGPYPVVKKLERHYTVKIKCNYVDISADRLKPAYLMMADANIPDYELPEKTLCLADNKLLCSHQPN